MSDTIDISEATRGGTATVEPPTPIPSAFNDAFAGLEAMVSTPEGTAPGSGAVPPKSTTPPVSVKPSSTPTTATPKDATTAKPESPSGKSASTDPKSSVAPATSKPAATVPDKPADEVPPEKMAPKQLREVYTKTKARVKELEAKLAEASNGHTAADDTEKKSLQEKLAAREQELNSIQEQLRLADYEKHPDYKKNYWEPFVEKFQEGRDLVKSLMVNDAEGNPRQGTEADFDALMRIQDPNTLADTVEAMFGAVKGSEVMAARRSVIEKNKARSKALEDHRALSVKNAEQTEAQVKHHRETWQKLNTEAAEKFPQWFKPTDGDSKDDKINELLQKGMALADYAFSGQVKPEEMVPVHSAIRNKAGAFDRVVYELQKARAENEELRKWKAEVEASAPAGGTTRRGAAPANDEATLEGAMNRLNALVG